MSWINCFVWLFGGITQSLIDLYTLYQQMGSRTLIETHKGMELICENKGHHCAMHLTLTWQKHEAPELWDLPTLISSQIITHQIRYSTNLVSSFEEIIVICEPFTYHCSLQCPPALSFRIYDKFLQHNWYAWCCRREGQDKGLDYRRFPSLSSAISRQFPTMKFVGDNATVSSNFNNPYLWSSGWPTRISAQIMVDGLHGNLYNNGYDTKYTIQFDSNDLTLSQILNVCNLSHVLAHIPSLLVDRVRVRQCSMQFGLVSGLLLVRGVTSNRRTDQFVLYHNDTTINPNICFSTPAENNIALIKIHDSTIINRTHKYLGSTGTSCAYVYLNAEYPLSSNNQFHSQAYRLFPKSSVVPVGSHFLFVKHFHKVIWAPSIEFENITEVADNEREPSNKSLHTHESYFNIPLALLCDSRCSSDLAHYVLDYVDIADVIFGLNILGHVQHNHCLLIDNKWWKRRLTREFGSSVTRWSDDVLTIWLHEWLDSKLPSMNSHHSQSVSVLDYARNQVQSQPVWFNAAVHLIVRLKCFSRDILKQNDTIRLPSAMRYVLLVSPPFQSCNKDMIVRDDEWSNEPNELWSRSEQIRIQTDGIPCHWFGQMGDVETQEDSYTGLYTGSSYVYGDDNTNEMSDLVNEVEDVPPADSDVESSDDSDIEESYDESDGHTGHKIILEVVLSDPDHWPVFELEFNLESILVVPNMHQFCIKHGVYQYCDEVSVTWNKKAAAIAGMSTESAEDDPEKAKSDYSDDDEFSQDKMRSCGPSFSFRFSKRHMNYVTAEIRDQLRIIQTFRR